MNLNIRIFIALMLFLLLAGSVYSQSTAERTDYPIGVNFSLWKGVSTQRNDSVGQSVLNVGLVSTLSQLNGLGVNALGSMTRHHVNGVQLTGLASMIRQSMNGLAVTGLVGIYADRMNGLSITGLAGIGGTESNGMMVSGLLNLGGTDASGLLLAGIANIVGEHFRGLSIGGLMNVAGDRMQGMQLSGILNVATHAYGVQLAPVNVTVKGKGVQIGLVNYYQQEFEGVQLGLVNLHAQTHIQLMTFGGNRSKLNLAVRFKNELFYTMLGIGSPYLDFKDKFSGSAFYRAGMEVPVYKKLYLSGDLGYQHVETFRNKHHGSPVRFYAIQARLNLELRAHERLGYFVSGGYSHERIYRHSGIYKHKPIIEGGIVFYSF
ncbi:hypothetical protein, secreted [gut metagenome]|uniref:Uncharacterized protein n=1 Tax=gut metagenome TaxID=749906 RepID=J9GGS0_9ZZZZ